MELTITGILHLIDSLAAGGAERVAVNLSNELAARGYNVTLCATRHRGPLEKLLSPQVNYVCLNRKKYIEFTSLKKLTFLIRTKKIIIIHAHSSSIFTAVLCKLLCRHIKVIWHLHGSTNIIDPLYRIASLFTDGIITVNEQLKSWVINVLGFKSDKVWLLHNFVISPPNQAFTFVPGERGFRIVCVANIRQPKDHSTLIKAMKKIVQVEPRAHLILIGAEGKPGSWQKLNEEIQAVELINSITWLGSRDDVASILSKCDIGVLSSVNEGLPLALLEYGIAGLAVVTTDVGDCSKVLEKGKFGLLVPHSSPDELANAILRILLDRSLCSTLGNEFQQHVKNQYSPQVNISILEQIYSTVIKNQ